MSFCIKCGKHNPESAKFCTGCGGALVATTAIATPIPPKTKTIQWIIIGALALGGLIAAYFLFFQKSKKTESTVDNNKLKELVHQWDAALNKNDAVAAASLYAENLVYYRSQMSRVGAQEILNNFFLSNPAYSQQIKGEITIEKQNDNLFTCSFNKSVTQDGKTTDYPSYLKFSKEDNDWKIVEEGDKITDYNINKNK